LGLRRTVDIDPDRAERIGVVVLLLRGASDTLGKQIFSGRIVLRGPEIAERDRAHDPVRNVVSLLRIGTENLRAVPFGEMVEQQFETRQRVLDPLPNPAPRVVRRRFGLEVGLSAEIRSVGGGQNPSNA
jgi:hypothetical protein